MSAEMEETGEERREAVRVKDRVLLYCRPVVEEEFRQINEEVSRGISLYNQERLAQVQIYATAQRALGRIRERDQDLADFLQQLDYKINLLLERGGQPDSMVSKLVLTEVDLSGMGIAFHTSRIYRAGDIAEMNIVLLPYYDYLCCFGQVVSCQEAEDDHYRLGLKFVLIMEEDREKLIQHNFRQQSRELRNRRLRQERE